MSEGNTRITTPEICEMLVVLLNEEAANITPHSQFADLAGWDSMGILLLMAELDERFSIALSEGQIKSLTTVADLIAILREHGILVE